MAENGILPGVEQPTIYWGETVGDYSNETEAQADFVRMAKESKAFTVHEQVRGSLLYPRPDTDAHDLRADVVLIPKATAEALRLGGAVVVEIKKSGIRIGPGLSQLMDYSQSVWTLMTEDRPHVHIVVKWAFLFPAHKQHGPLASLLAQHRIGTACVNKWSKKCEFFCGEQHVMDVTSDGCTVCNVNFGSKTGAR